jgi:hypothetical protein
MVVKLMVAQHIKNRVWPLGKTPYRFGFLVNIACKNQNVCPGGIKPIDPKIVGKALVKEL